MINYKDFIIIIKRILFKSKVQYIPLTFIAVINIFNEKTFTLYTIRFNFSVGKWSFGVAED